MFGPFKSPGAEYAVEKVKFVDHVYGLDSVGTPKLSGAGDGVLDDASGEEFAEAAGSRDGVVCKIMLVGAWIAISRETSCFLASSLLATYSVDGRIGA